MSIADRLKSVNERIAKAAEKSNRSPEEITLVAVTKTKPVALLEEAYAAGLRHFGENRTHELVEKRPYLDQKLGEDNRIVWHFIGHLQTRQSAAVVEHADLFHAVDRHKIITRLNNQSDRRAKPLKVLLEVNTSGEENKAGYRCADWEEDAQQRASVLEAARRLHESEALELNGLMTMAPWGAEPAFIRSVFDRTRNLRNWINQQLDINMGVLSMGMTDDFEIAIEAGATHIRVGRALFGERT
ncbi:MAG: YggS family pyridoxal phosphate-dependent enzyme [Chloroflexota bacterium]